MGWRHLDRLAVCGLAACLPTTSPASPVGPTEVRPTAVVPIAAVPPQAPRPTASSLTPPPPPRPRHEEVPPLVDAGSLNDFPDYRVAPWWTPPPKPPPNPTASIARAMPRFRRALRNCYASSLKSNPNMHGQVSVKFTVDRDGRVVAVVTKQNPSLDGLARCIRATLQRMPFPPQDPPTEVAFPILFVAPTSPHP